MNYFIRFTSKAYKQFKKIPRGVQSRLKEHIDSLAHNPRPPCAVPIKIRKDTFRIREGDYRIIYSIQEDILLVLIIKIGHYSEVYRKLSRL